MFVFMVLIIIQDFFNCNFGLLFDVGKKLLFMKMEGEGGGVKSWRNFSLYIF